MKKNLKLIAMIAALTSLTALSSCSGSKKVIGILQPVEHQALDLAREGFIEGLKDKGFIEDENIKILYQNANGNEADQNQLAKDLTAKCDVTLGIGTGAAQSLFAAELNKSTKPILFTAVTDPVSAQLVKSNEHPGGFVTGTSDASPVEAQISLIKSVLPLAKKLGVLYTQSEINSEVQANQAKAQAEKDGLEVIVSTCTSTADLSAVALDICGNKNIDALYIPTDNLIAANFEAVKTAANKNKVLTVVGEESLVASGGHITLSIDYFMLGKRTGNMCAEVLNGTNPGEMKVETMSINDCKYKYNPESLLEAGITLPEDVAAKFERVN